MQLHLSFTYALANSTPSIAFKIDTFHQSGQSGWREYFILLARSEAKRLTATVLDIWLCVKEISSYFDEGTYHMSLKRHVPLWWMELLIFSYFKGKNRMKRRVFECAVKYKKWENVM